jgi:tetratricopeptide (TPR) repeat protein
MSSPPQYTVAGRPIASLSLALNYAISGYEVWSYHLFNLLVHILAGLTLYGIIRRTLLCERLRERFGKHSAVLAWAAAAIWVVHPIQTESVTYIVQRTESMMGLFYLLTLYSAVRAMQSDKPLIWPAVSVICCGLGMGTKEVMVTAPAMVLLYDRAFFAASFGAAFRRRWGLYVGLAAIWVILLVLIHTAPRSHTAGFAFGYKSLDYAMNQCVVILHYIRLSVWPAGLCLDYSWPVVKDFGRFLPFAAVVAAMVAAAIWGLVRNKAWSYPAAWFFVILAPTSSFVPLMDVIFEHRMYLSLAGVVVPAVLTGYVLFERLSARRLMAALAAAVIVALGWGTFLRNNDYRSGESIWQKALDVVPNNVRAYYNLGLAMQKQGRLPEAIRNYNQAIRLNPDYYRAYYNLGHLMQSGGRLKEAAGYYQQVIAIKPDLADAYCNLGSAFLSMGRFDEAISEYRKALSIQPNDAETYNNLGLVFIRLGKFDEAEQQLRKALEISPDLPDAHRNLAVALKSQGKIEEAMVHYKKAKKYSSTKTTEE